VEFSCVTGRRGAGSSISESARALALVNMAISDAQATVFETKYHYRVWRPETAIRAGDSDGNRLTRGDPSFMPFVLTPCFPSYGSAHGSSSGAAREVLERVFGPRHHFIALSNPAVAASCFSTAASGRSRATSTMRACMAAFTSASIRRPARN
jgi:hypothetical protein